MKNHRDYSSIDLEELSETFLPRTSFQRGVPRDQYVSHYTQWDAKSANLFWRLAWRRRVDSEMARTLGGLKWSCRHPDIVPVTSSDG